MPVTENLEIDIRRRSSRQQRIVTTSLYYVQKFCVAEAVSNHDLHRWQEMQDSNTALSQQSILAVLNRLEEQQVTESLWEVPNKVIRRPPRKFHYLTVKGVDVAIQNIQELRASPDRPKWILIPELEDGRWEPESPEGFVLQEPVGRLASLTE